MEKTYKKFFWAHYQCLKALRKRILKSWRVKDYLYEMGEGIDGKLFNSPVATKVFSLINDLEENDALLALDARLYREADVLDKAISGLEFDFDKDDDAYHREVDYQTMRNK